MSSFCSTVTCARFAWMIVVSSSSNEPICSVTLARWSSTSRKYSRISGCTNRTGRSDSVRSGACSGATDRRSSSTSRLST
jgi:hypothetical protein